ncbi:MAG: acetamidase/formamidase family protein, partial [Geminicoccales bacterium]
MPQHHEIAPVPENMVWGYLDAAVAPVLRIASGDTVALTSWAASNESRLPADRSRVKPDHLRALRECEPGPTTHLIVGPVHVEGAVPGDVLQIEILEIALVDDWGYVAMRPLMGTLPEQFDRAHIIHPTIDRARGVCRLPWGRELPLDPFFGVIAVAPPAHWGRCSSMQPRKFGGNMDNKELRAGTTLYLPVLNEGALFHAGDGHGVQGDGEVCVTALETSLFGKFRLTVRKDLDFTQPFAESATHLIGIGLHEDLARQALREMITHVCRRTALRDHEAYMLCSLAGDLRVTQTVNGVKGCHMMLAKSCL